VVRVPHALQRTRRAARVVDRHQVVRPHGAPARVEPAVVAGDSGPAGRQEARPVVDRDRAGDAGQPVEFGAAVDDHDVDSQRPHDGGQLLVGERLEQAHRHRSGVRQREIRDGELGPVGQQQAHQVARPDAELPQAQRCRRHLGPQFPPGQRLPRIAGTPRVGGDVAVPAHRVVERVEQCPAVHGRFDVRLNRHRRPPG
jgi:hypothetical protein